MRIQLSIILARCTFLGMMVFVLMSLQIPHVFSARTVAYQMRSGAPLSEQVGYFRSADEMVTISISASTNSCSSTINVYATGLMTYQTCAKQGRSIVTSNVLSPFFQDIQVAQPLSVLPNVPCLKSASFGTTTKILTGGKISPDISCPSNVIEEKLFKDVHAIEAVSTYPAPKRSF